MTQKQEDGARKIYIVTRKENTYGPYRDDVHTFDTMKRDSKRIAVCSSNESALAQIDIDYNKQPVIEAHAARMRKLMGENGARMFAPIRAESAAQGRFYDGMQYEIEEVPVIA